MKLKPPSPLILACISLLVIHVLCIKNAFPQLKSNSDVTIVNEVSKFLGRDGNLTAVPTKEQYYAFNLKIELSKKSGAYILAVASFSNSIGAKIFPNYKKLNKFDYKSLLKNKNHWVIIVPILILNNPTDDKNPSDLITGISKQSLTNLISSIIYPDTLQKDIILFPLFTVSRADVQ